MWIFRLSAFSRAIADNLALFSELKKKKIQICAGNKYVSIHTTLYEASVAQLAAHQSHNLKAVSSSLTGGNFFKQFFN
jgi:hypothetical protein